MYVIPLFAIHTYKGLRYSPVKLELGVNKSIGKTYGVSKMGYIRQLHNCLTTRRGCVCSVPLHGRDRRGSNGTKRSLVRSMAM